MKNKSGSASTIIVLVIGVLGFAAILCWALLQKQNNTIDTGGYNLSEIIPASKESGNISEHVEGAKNAKLTIIEYSDYQCSGCASVVDDVEQLLEKYKDDVAVIHRTYVLSYHTNGTAAAVAVEAAGLQGYWKKYGDYLFENQSDWYYSDATKRTEQFISYFDIVTEGKGDKEKFKADLESDKTKAKVEFDKALGASVKDQIQYTPAFFIDGEFIDWAYENKEELSFVDYFSKIIDEKLEELKD